MEITPMVSMAAESTDTERAQTIASQLVHCAQHASAVEWMCAGSCACARSKSTLTSKMLLRSRWKLSLDIDRQATHIAVMCRHQCRRPVPRRPAGPLAASPQKHNLINRFY